MSNDDRAQKITDNIFEEFWQRLVEKIPGDKKLNVPILLLRLVILVVLYAVSKFSFEGSLGLARLAEPSQSNGLVLFLLAVVCWLEGSRFLIITIFHLGLRRLVVFLVIGAVILAAVLTALPHGDQPSHGDILSIAESMLSRTYHLAMDIVMSQIQAPAKFWHEYTAQARSTSTPATGLKAASPTPISTSRLIQQPVRAASTATPHRSLFPLKATPKAASPSQAPLAIDFLIDSIESNQNTIKLNVTIKRRADTSLPWTSDENRRGKICLQAGSHRYDLVEMGGIFTQDTTLQAGNSYKGWLAFKKPVEAVFTLYYPDIEPLPIGDLF